MKKSVFPIIYYAVLFLMLSLGVILFLSFRTNPTMQIYIGMLLSALYVGWGVIYHWMEDSFHIQVVIEYLLVGLIAIALIVTLVWI